MADVDAEAQFPGVGVGELPGGVGAWLHSGGHGEPVLPEHIHVLRPFHFDHLGAQGGQPTCGPRSCPDPGEVYDADPL